MGKRCKRRDCPGYVDVWMGDQGVRLLENLRAYDGKVRMLTITAPGADRLPWDVASCGHTAGECSGRLGCRVVPSIARAYNEQSQRAWSMLWNSTRGRINRRLGAGALRLLAYAPETQARGVIHLHLILGAETPRERHALEMATVELKRLAAGYGWGFVDDGRQRKSGREHGRPVAAGGPLWEPLQAASYVAKYLTHPDKRGGVRELVMSGQAPTRAVYVSSSLTRRTRCTMRNLRTRRYLYRTLGEHYPMWEVEGVRDFLRCRRLWDASAAHARARHRLPPASFPPDACTCPAC